MRCGADHTFQEIGTRKVGERVPEIATEENSKDNEGGARMLAYVDDLVRLEEISDKEDQVEAPEGGS